MTTAQLLRINLPAARGDSVTTRAKAALAVRRAKFGPVRCALRDFGVWARSGATPRQCARQALNTFRAFV